MTFEEYELVLGPKVEGTNNLLRTFDTPCLDFVIMLSSTAGVLGARGSANYSAGNAYLDAIANLRQTSNAHITSFNLGPMKEVGIVARDPRLERLFKSQGLIALTNKELFVFLDYAASPQAKEEDCRQIITSFTRSTAKDAGNINILNNPLVRLLPHRKVQEASTLKTRQARGIQELIAETETEADALQIIICHITKKISSLAAVDEGALTEDFNLESLGMDSLVVIELKNWITRDMLTTLQPSEIFEAINISGIARRIAEKSPLIQKNVQDSKVNESQPEPTTHTVPVSTNGTNGANKVSGVAGVLSHDVKLPLHPIPVMEDMLESFLAASSCIASEGELKQTRDCVREFLKPNSAGRRLHDRLVEYTSDPSIDNWFSDILKQDLLGKRISLVPSQNYIGVYPCIEGAIQPRAAERAATISLAAFRCKKALETGQITNDLLVERTLDMNSYDGLFNVNREPCKGIDKIHRYPNYDHIVVFKNGLAFKVPMENPTWASLQATFEEINSVPPDENSWVPALTLDERDEWAEVS